MSSQWRNFLRNQGEWRGSFTSLSAAGVELDSTPSILSLEPAEEDRLVRFHLRRYAAGALDGEPTREVRTDYRTLGRQVVFFDSGSFSKGSLQIAPNTASGAEFGFIHGDRRFRLVQLFTEAGGFDGHVLIREFRTGSGARERPVLRPEHLLGRWQGEGATISADWPVPELRSVQMEVQREAPGQLRIETQDREERTLLLCHGPVAAEGGEEAVGPAAGARLRVDGANPGLLQCLADGGYSLIPEQISHRQAFVVEAGWMVADDRLERLIRRYDASGAWLSASHEVLTRL